MKIANPLYDHAFKYLMSNDKLARKVLSVILEKEVLELELSQQEVVVEDEDRRFTLYRLDFKALIEDENGRKETVLIEPHRAISHTVQSSLGHGRKIHPRFARDTGRL